MPKTRAPKGSRFQNNPAGKAPGTPQGKPAAKAAPPSQHRAQRGLPDRDTLLKYIREGGETDKAALAKAFGLKGEERRVLRQMLQTLQEEDRKSVV